MQHQAIIALLTLCQEGYWLQDHSLLWVTEILESKTSDKGDYYIWLKKKDKKESNVDMSSVFSVSIRKVFG